MKVAAISPPLAPLLQYRVQCSTNPPNSGEPRIRMTPDPPPPGGWIDFGPRQDGGKADICAGGGGLDGKDFWSDLHGLENLQKCNFGQGHNASAMQIAFVQNAAMSRDDPQTAALAFLIEAVAKSGLKPSALAKRAGVAPSTITRPLNEPEFQFIPKAATLAKIAKAAGIVLPNTILSLDSPSIERSTEVLLQIRYEVAAGNWRAADDIRDQPYGTFPAHQLEAYADYPQWLERVVGDSMDRKLPPGTLAHVVDAIAIGYAPRHWDLVVVVRRRASGAFEERSIKEVVIEVNQVSLWPRSHNPSWSAPLSLNEGGTDSTTEVEISGLVVRAYFVFGGTNE